MCTHKHTHTPTQHIIIKQKQFEVIFVFNKTGLQQQKRKNLLMKQAKEREFVFLIIIY